MAWRCGAPWAPQTTVWCWLALAQRMGRPLDASIHMNLVITWRALQVVHWPTSERAGPSLLPLLVSSFVSIDFEFVKSVSGSSRDVCGGLWQCGPMSTRDRGHLTTTSSETLWKLPPGSHSLSLNHQQGHGQLAFHDQHCLILL